MPTVVFKKIFLFLFQSPRILIESSKVVFDSTGYGAQGENEYHFELALPHDVNSDVGTPTVNIIH